MHRKVPLEGTATILVAVVVCTSPVVVLANIGYKSEVDDDFDTLSKDAPPPAVVEPA